MSEISSDEAINRVYASRMLDGYYDTGEWKLSDQEHRELMGTFQIEQSVAAAHAFLGKNMARTLLKEVRREISLMENGIYE